MRIGSSCLILLGTVVACGAPVRRERPHVSIEQSAWPRLVDGVVDGLVRVTVPAGHAVDHCRLVVDWSGRSSEGETDPLPPDEVDSPTEAVWRFAVDVPPDEDTVRVLGRVTCDDLEGALAGHYASNERALARYCALCPDRDPPAALEYVTADYGIDVVPRVGVAVRVLDHGVIDECDGTELLPLADGARASIPWDVHQTESALLHAADHGEAVCGSTAPRLLVAAPADQLAGIVEHLRASGKVVAIAPGSPPPP